MKLDLAIHYERKFLKGLENFLCCAIDHYQRLPDSYLPFFAVKELIEVHEAVQETAPDYLAAYLTDPSDGGRLARTHRVLQALNADPSTGNATTCNQLCKTKAVIIESALIVSGTSSSLVGHFAATRKLAFSFDLKAPLCCSLINPILDDNCDLRKLGASCPLRGQT